MQEPKYRNTTTGELGFLFEKDGKRFVRLNRTREDIVLPYRESEWIPERDSRPLTLMQCAQVALEADVKLCLFLGLHKETRRRWLSMTDEQRIEWTQVGPSGSFVSDAVDPITTARVRVNDAIMAALEPYTVE